MSAAARVAADGVPASGRKPLVAGNWKMHNNHLEALALTQDGKTAWVCGGDGTLVSVDLAGGRVTRRLRVGNHPSAVVIADGRESTS